MFHLLLGMALALDNRWAPVSTHRGCLLQFVASHWRNLLVQP